MELYDALPTKAVTGELAKIENGKSTDRKQNAGEYPQKLATDMKTLEHIRTARAELVSGSKAAGGAETQMLGDRDAITESTNSPQWYDPHCGTHHIWKSHLLTIVTRVVASVGD